MKGCDGLDEREPYKIVLKFFMMTVRHCISRIRLFLGCLSTVQYVGTYYGWPNVSHSHWSHPAFGIHFSMFNLYSGNTRCWRWNRLALATYNDTLYVSVLFDMRDSGGFLTSHSVLSFSVSTIFGRLCFYKRLYCLHFFSL